MKILSGASHPAVYVDDTVFDKLSKYALALTQRATIVCDCIVDDAVTMESGHGGGGFARLSLPSGLYLRSAYPYQPSCVRQNGGTAGSSHRKAALFCGKALERAAEIQPPKYDEDKKKIELRKLSAEADLAEQQALKQKLENIETMRRLQLSSVDAYAEPLATAAKNLAVQPSSATIIDITKILKSQQEDQPPQ